MVKSFGWGLLIAFVVGCGGEADNDESAPGTSELGATAPRPAIRGLLDRSFAPPIDAQTPSVDENVVQLFWEELEASGAGTMSGGFYAPHTHGWAQIEAAFAAGPVRVRILAGSHAPQYAKRLGFGGVFDGGGSTGQCTDGGVYVYNPHDHTGGCVPKFWTAAYLARYAALLAEVQARYGAETRVREVVDSACMTNYAEPFYRAHSDHDSNQRLIDAGLTWKKDVYCHQQAILLHKSKLPAIRTSLAVNAWDQMDTTQGDLARSRFDETFDFVEGGPLVPRRVDASGNDLAATWAGARAELGARLVLQNNGLGENDGCKLAGGDTLANAHHDTFCFLSYIAKTTATSVGFQTETMDRLRGKDSPIDPYLRTAGQGVEMALDNALSMHASFVELPGGYRSWTSASDLQMLSDEDELLEQNAP